MDINCDDLFFVSNFKSWEFLNSSILQGCSLKTGR